MTADGQTIVVPDKYKSLGVQTGFNPNMANDLRWIIAGMSGSGKTNLITSDPQSIIIDTDKAAQNVYDNRAARFPVDNWDDYTKIRDMLCLDKEAKSTNCPWPCAVR